MPKSKDPDDTADAALWKAVTGDVKPLKGQKQENPENSGGRRLSARVVMPPSRPDRLPDPKSSGEVDRNTRQKLEQGKMPIEGRLDLHGHTQDRARAALTDFLLESYKRRRRCVLVITGKGREDSETDIHVSRTSGVLRHRVPDWLAAPPLNAVVLRTAPARRNHGGEGALYVYLRKNKEPV